MNLQLMAPPTTRAINQTLRDLAYLDDNEPALTRPVGGWRTKRCDHGLRCDSEEWLCESCEPQTDGEREAKARLLESFPRWPGKSVKIQSAADFSTTLLSILRAGNIGDLGQLSDAMTAALGRNCRPGNVSLCLRRLQRIGRVVGWKVVE